MSFICNLFRKKKKDPIKVIYGTDFAYLSDEEVELVVDTIHYIQEQTQITVTYNRYLQSFAEERTLYWEREGFDHEDNLHMNVLGDMKPYKDQGFFTIMVELANYGFQNDLNAFKNSSKHNPYLVSGEYNYVGASMRGPYCCLALAK